MPLCLFVILFTAVLLIFAGFGVFLVVKSIAVHAPKSQSLDAGYALDADSIEGGRFSVLSICVDGFFWKYEPRFPIERL